MAEDLRKPPARISLLALPEATPFALYGLYEVFQAVGVAWPALTGEATGTPPLAVEIVAPQRSAFITAGGIPIAPHRALAAVADADVVIIPDLALPLDADPRGLWPEAAAWLRARYAGGARLCAVCSGTLVLADTGLLDGCEATIHWGFRDLVRRYYPDVRLRADRIVVTAGPDGRLVTGGGASAWEDLALFLIARICGEAEAIRIRKLFLFGDRSTGQLPYAAMNRRRDHDDRVIADVQVWLADHYAKAHPVQEMVARSGLNARTFKRRFKAATGFAPLAYVQMLRIEEAKQALESSDALVDEIALAVGYEDPTSFRTLFRRLAGLAPSHYRRKFRRPAGGASARAAGTL